MSLKNTMTTQSCCTSLPYFLGRRMVLRFFFYLSPHRLVLIETNKGWYKERSHKWLKSSSCQENLCINERIETTGASETGKWEQLCSIIFHCPTVRSLWQLLRLQNDVFACFKWQCLWQACGLWCAPHSSRQLQYCFSNFQQLLPASMSTLQFLKLLVHSFDIRKVNPIHSRWRVRYSTSCHAWSLYRHTYKAVL